MNSIVKNIFNIISSILFFNVFFVICMVTNSPVVFTKKNILLVILSIAIYSAFVIVSDKSLRYLDMKQVGKNGMSKKDKLIGQFVDDVMEYCVSQGINPSMNFDDESNLVIVDINKDNKKVIDFSMPTEKDLKEKNYNLHLEHIKDLINKAKDSEE